MQLDAASAGVEAAPGPRPEHRCGDRPGRRAPGGRPRPRPGPAPRHWPVGIRRARASGRRRRALRPAPSSPAAPPALAGSRRGRCARSGCGRRRARAAPTSRSTASNHRRDSSSSGPRSGSFRFGPAATSATAGNSDDSLDRLLEQRRRGADVQPREAGALAPEVRPRAERHLALPRIAREGSSPRSSARRSSQAR